MSIISHINPKENWAIQSNEDHSNGVAKLCSKFASEFGMGTFGKIAGLLHDKGKEKKAFQQHIKRESGLEPHTKVDGDYSHAYVGALIAKQLYPQIHPFLSTQIIGHHRGLYNYTAFECEMSKHEIPSDVTVPDATDTSLMRSELQKLRRDLKGKDFHHLQRMLYSCLVDADFLDTEAFMDRQSASLRQSNITLDELYPKLHTFLENIKRNAPDTAVNRIRDKVQQRCIATSSGPKGFYSLTVPTGGGKTLSSLLWAILHAKEHGMKRIIIAIPYTSIIVQTASVLKSIFGEENVLENHSNVDPESIKNEVLLQKMRMASENWDYPIVVTTNVQLFESMMSNKPSKCRRLHNIVNSVIILDEAQTLPIDFLQPIVDTLKTYQKCFGTSVLFTTASQPVLSGVIKGCNPKAHFEGIDHIEEIIPEEYQLHDQLRRVKLEIDTEARSFNEIAKAVSKHERVLCIVSTRKAAKEIFDRLPQEGITLHLSRMMCPDHVTETIEEIKSALKDKNNRIIRVVATQLVEAGVDIDFPVVFRQEAGLDSVLQAAGRCNREGKLGICTTHVFCLKDAIPFGGLAKGVSAMKNLPHDSDWFAPTTMSKYFNQLYCRIDIFDKKEIKNFLYLPKEVCYETAAKEFKLIDDNSISVVVCWKDSLQLVEQIKQNGPSYTLMKKLAKYTVGVRETDFNALLSAGAVEKVLEGLYVVSDAAAYNHKSGLSTNNHWLEEIIYFYTK